MFQDNFSSLLCIECFKAALDHTGTVNIGGCIITNFQFADDIDGLAGKEEELVNLVN